MRALWFPTPTQEDDNDEEDQTDDSVVGSCHFAGGNEARFGGNHPHHKPRQVCWLFFLSAVCVSHLLLQRDHRHVWKIASASVLLQAEVKMIREDVGPVSACVP